MIFNYSSSTKWVFGTIGSMVTLLFGNSTKVFYVLIAFMAIDVLSGILKAFKNKKLRSFFMSWGIIQKAGILLAILISLLLDILINQGSPAFSLLMIWVSIGNEGLSILENLDAIGVKLPKKIKDSLLDMSLLDDTDIDKNPLISKDAELKMMSDIKREEK